jgi:pSer/pThr/pTyr-binding forkhead associated (FHA) protein
MWILKASGGNAGDVTFRLLPGSIKTLGRAPRADFVLDAPLVSRLHCRFSLSEDGALTVVDLGSTNGTLVNELKVQQAELVPGDCIRIGRVELTVTQQSQVGEPVQEDTAGADPRRSRSPQSRP